MADAANTFSTAILIDPDGQARKQTAELAAEAAKFRQEVLRLAKGIRDEMAALKSQGEQQRRATKIHEDAAVKLKRLERQQRLVNKVMRETGASAATAGKVVRAFGKDMDRAEREAVGYARGLDKAARETRELTVRQRAASSGMSLASKTARSLALNIIGLAAAYFSAQAVIRAVNGLITGSITAFSDLEDAVVSLRKVTDGLGQQGLTDLVARLEDLSTSTVPIATESLIELAAVAGQLGIETEEGLANAAATGAKLAAATDLTGAAAITALARILAIQGQSIDAIDNIGAALTKLGNTSKATEAKIIPIASEINRATAAFDLGGEKVLGWAAAMAEMDIRAESGGSALSELFNAIVKATETGKGLEELARVAGVSADELKRLAASDISSAALTFLDGLARFGKRGSLALESVGLASKVTAKALVPLAKNSERVAERLQTSADASRENTALNKEAAAAFATLRADGQRLTNALKLLLAEGFAPLAKPLKALLQDTAGAIVEIRGLVKAFKEIPGATSSASAGVDLLTDSLRPNAEAWKLLSDVLTDLSEGALRNIATDMTLLAQIPGGGLFGNLASIVDGVAQLSGSGGTPLLAKLASDLGDVDDSADSLEGFELGDLFKKWAEGAKKVPPTLAKVETALEKLQIKAAAALTTERQGIAGRTAVVAKSFGAASQEIEFLTVGLGRLQTASEFLNEINLDAILIARRQKDAKDLIQGVTREIIEAEIMRLEVDRQIEELAKSGAISKEMEKQLRAALGIASAADLALDSWIGWTNAVRDAFGGLSADLDNFIGGISSVANSLQNLRGAQGVAGTAQAGAGVGGAVGELGVSTGFFKGQRGTGQFGGQLSGDMGKLGAQVGGAVGAVIGAFFFGFGAIVGSLIGSLLGGVLGKLIKTGADEGLLQLRQVGDDIEGTITRAEGTLGKAVGSIGDAISAIFEDLESVLGLQIELAASEIVGGSGISGAGVAAAIKIRDGIVIGFVNGLRAEFEGDDAVARAIEFVTLELLKSATFVGGVSENVKKALGGGASTVEGLEEFLNFALAVDDATSGAGELAVAWRGLNALRIQDIRTAKTLGISIAETLKLTDLRIAALKKEVEANLDSIIGFTDTAAILANLSQGVLEFNAGLLAERAAREAELVTLRGQEVGQRAANQQALEAIEAAGGMQAVMQRARDEMTSVGGAFDRLTGDGFVPMAGSARELLDNLRLSEAGLGNAAEGIADIEEGLSNLPDAIDFDKMLAAAEAAAARAGDALAEMVEAVRGEGALATERQELANVAFEIQLASQIASVQLLIQMTDLLSDTTRAVLQGIVDAGIDLLGDLGTGAATFGGGGRRPGAGGGRRAEAKRQAEELATAQDSLAEAMLGFREQLSGASADQLAWNQRVEEFRQLAQDAAASQKEMNEGLRQMAAIDLAELGRQWATTAADFRRSDLAGGVRDIGAARRQAIEEANARAESDPAGAAAAKKEIRETARRQFAELGKAALDGLGGPLRNLNQTGKETIRTIEFIADNLDKLGISAAQLARVVRDQVLPGLLGMAIAEAERVGDTVLLAELQDRRQKLEKSFALAQLAIWRQMLETADAMTDTLDKLFVDIEAMLELPDAPGIVGGGGRRTRTSTVSTAATVTAISNLDALRDAISDFIRGMTELELRPFERQAQDWLNTVADFSRGIADVISGLSGGDRGLLQIASSFAGFGAGGFLSGDESTIQAILDFVRETSPGNVLRGIEDELELLLAGAGLEGSLGGGFANLIKQFRGPLEDALSPLEQLDIAYADLLSAADLLKASDAERMDAEIAFHELRTKLQDEQLGGLRELRDEAMTAILRSRAPREQLITARQEFEAASAAANINDAGSIARLEAAIRNYQSVAAGYDELVGVNITASVNDAVAAALHLFLDPFSSTPSATLPIGTLLSNEIGSSVGLPGQGFVPSASTVSSAPGAVVVNVTGLEALGGEFLDFKTQIEDRWIADDTRWRHLQETVESIDGGIN